MNISCWEAKAKGISMWYTVCIPITNVVVAQAEISTTKYNAHNLR
jgi:hypothetical protein